jgi:hypothetical protein
MDVFLRSWGDPKAVTVIPKCRLGVVTLLTVRVLAGVVNEDRFHLAGSDALTYAMARRLALFKLNGLLSPVEYPLLDGVVAVLNCAVLLLIEPWESC